MTAGRSCSDRWPVLAAWLLSATTWSCVGEAAAQENAVAREDPPLMEIGVIQGDRSRMFGRIDDVDVDSNGNIVVLDGQSYSVSWFSPDGRYLGTAGRQGEGPAEFQGPEGLAVGPDNLVYVLDAPGRTVHVFGLSSSDGPKSARLLLFTFSRLTATSCRRSGCRWTRARTWRLQYCDERSRIATTEATCRARPIA